MKIANRKSTYLTIILIAFVAVMPLIIIKVLHRNTQPDRSGVPTIRVAYRPRALADISPVIIKEFGITDPRVHVELVPVSDPVSAFQKFDAGEVDAMAGVPLETILKELSDPNKSGKRSFIAYYQQLDVNGQGWVSIVGNPKAGVSMLSDLAGKQAAALPTDQARWLLKRILLAAGIPAGEIKIGQYNPATPTAGLAAGTYAAAFGLEPMISKALNEGDILLARGPISHYLYNDKPVVVSASVISTDYFSKHKDAYEAFVAMIDRAVDLTNQKPDQVRQVFTKRDYGELDPAIASKLFLPVMAKPSVNNRDVVKQFVEDARHDGILKGEVDLAPLFPEFLGH